MACSNCHYGNEVDFAVIMERSSDAARTSLAVTCSGDIPAYSNGSSCSTATFAGMAALVWAKQGTDVSSGTIMSSLIQSSSNNFIDHPDFGFGWVDMNTALQF